MENLEAPRSLQHHMSVQQVGTETLVYDERRHRAFCLNKSSSIIWRLADGKRTITEISMTASFQLNTAVSEELVSFAIDELRKDGLIEPSAIGPAGPSISRRAMLQRLGVGGIILLPAIAAIVAPTAAQAYSGCVDCSTMSSAQLARARRQRRIEEDRSASIPDNANPPSQ